MDNPARSSADFGDSDPEIEAREYYMGLAIAQARAAAELDEVPVGAVIILKGRVVGAAHNQCISLKDATAHAEMLAITQAAESIGDWRLEQCTLFVTLEPCVMCAGAIINSRIPNVVFGALDPKGGAAGSLFNLLTDTRLNHRCHIVSGVSAESCGRILTDFFHQKRIAGKR